MEGALDGIGCLFVIAILGIVGTLAFGGTYFYDKKIESNKIIVPEIRLETDGKKIDTIYIYKIQGSNNGQ